MFMLEDDFGIKVRVKRAKEKITLKQLAKKINISRKTLSLIEKDKKEKLNSKTYQNVMNWLIDDKF